MIGKICWMLFLMPLLVFGNIIETNRFADILDHLDVNKRTLVICDIDNTLLESEQQLGSVAWGDHMIAELKRKGLSEWQAEEIENIYWRLVQPYISVRPVDPHTQDVVRYMQQQGVDVLGLTARAPQEAACTVAQLKAIGVAFKDEATYELPVQPPALYHAGILFSTPHHKKSDVLLAFLAKSQIDPAFVIYIDDKISHVQDVVQRLENEKVPCIGIRFSGADARMKEFDAHVAEIQWKAFPDLLSDDEVRQSIAPVQNVHP
jgi:hypothetical protein